MENKFSELRCKEVVNTATGARLGCVDDLLIDTREGRILALIVPAPCRLFSFFNRGETAIIPWPCIKRVGADIILVDYPKELEQKT